MDTVLWYRQLPSATQNGIKLKVRRVRYCVYANGNVAALGLVDCPHLNKTDHVGRKFWYEVSSIFCGIEVALESLKNANHITNLFFGRIYWQGYFTNQINEISYVIGQF